MPDEVYPVISSPTARYLALRAARKRVIGFLLALAILAMGTPVVAAGLTQQQIKAIAKLEAKLAKAQAKEAAAFDKLLAGMADLIAAAEMLAQAQSLPATTPVELKLKTKLVGKAAKLLAKANVAVGKAWSGVEAMRALQQLLIDQIEAIDPFHFATAGPVLGASGGDGAVTFNWSPVTGASSYTLYWSLTPSVDPETAAAVTGVSSPFVLDGLGDGLDIHAIVQATVAGEPTQFSNEISASTSPPPDAPGIYDPPWADAVPSNVITLDFNPGQSATQNGATLKSTINALQPGDRLEVGAGTWSVDSQFTITLQGTPGAPIWITAQDGEVPVITRPDAAKNVINVGTGTPGSTRYVVLQRLEITGGSAGMRIYGSRNLWVDRCEIHATEDAGLTANSVDTEFLYLTRNHIHHTAGYGEGMYLGANNSASVMSQSVIALNHVHDTTGLQGDGIEIKQGSWGNWIAENYIHDTKYPCLLLYGTDGHAVNIVERNILIGSDDNVLQVQGEAIVRNNLIMAGATGFHSHDHQGSTRDLTFVHNTIVNSGRATRMSNWNNRPGMTFANNVVYSQSSNSINFAGGSAGVELGGNVVFGSTVNTPSFAFILGAGLSDFVDASWNGSDFDVTPTPLSVIVGAASATWGVANDLYGNARTGSLEAGCIDL